MAAASSATMLALASGFGLHRVPADGKNIPCSAHLSTISKVRTGSSIPYGRNMHLTSGLFGDLFLVHDNYPRMAYAQSASSRPLCTAAAVGTVRKEPVTGIQFSNTVTPPGGSTEQVLLGCGVREKKFAFLKVKVYAVGFYLAKSSSADVILGDWKRKAGAELAEDEAFFKALMEAPVEKSLRIVLARDVDGGQFWSALDEALTPRLKAAAAGSAGADALAAFGNVFRDRALKQGTTVFLTWCQPCTLHISISSPRGSSNSSIPNASIDSAPLVSCLFDVYLGKDPVSPSAKGSIADGYSSLL